MIALCGLLAGSAMACKYTGAVSVVVPLAVMIALRAVAAKEPIGLRVKQAVWELALFGVGALLAVGPWLVKNAVETGNPVFPLAYSVFGGEGRDATMDAQWQQGHSAPPYRSVSHRLSDLVIKLTDVAANNDWHSALITASGTTTETATVYLHAIAEPANKPQSAISLCLVPSPLALEGRGLG